MLPPPPPAPRVSELQRIIDLPRVGDAGADVSELYRRPGGTQTLRPAQSRALAHAAEHGGILAPVGVGHGKTLICALLPVAVRAARPLLLIPASQRADFGAQWSVYAGHWHLAKGLTVHSYDALSRPDATAMLTGLAPVTRPTDYRTRPRHGLAVSPGISPRTPRRCFARCPGASPPKA